MAAAKLKSKTTANSSKAPVKAAKSVPMKVAKAPPSKAPSKPTPSKTPPAKPSPTVARPMPCCWPCAAVVGRSCPARATRCRCENGQNPKGWRLHHGETSIDMPACNPISAIRGLASNRRHCR